MKRIGVDKDGFNVYRANHGTTTEYASGCRCEKCREAVNRYVRRRRKAAKRANAHT